MYVVTVEITVPAEHFAVFLPLMLKNAEISRTDEPGCRQFDVAVPAEKGQATQVFLYEVYEDRAAFDVHLRSNHYLSFAAAIATLVTERTLRTWERLAP